MNREQLLSRISINPNICFGKPCIKGHRIWVSLILDFLASGMSIPELLEEYPGLETADFMPVLPTVPRCRVSGMLTFLWNLLCETEAG
jgi:uncharacterized protein (DUF433 family)